MREDIKNLLETEKDLSIETVDELDNKILATNFFENMANDIDEFDKIAWENKAGFDSPKLTAHSTRHTTATLSLLNGATLQQTQALLRHKNMQTTEIYAHNIQASKNPASNDVANAIFN